LKQEVKASETKLVEESEKSQQALQASLEQNERDVSSALNQAHENKKLAVNRAHLEADIRWTDILKKKERALAVAWQEEQKSVVATERIDNATKISRAVEHERQNAREMIASIEQLKSEHEEEKKKLQELVQLTRNETDNVKKSLMKEHETQGTREMEDQITKVSR
jgi:hypothetical protein